MVARAARHLALAILKAKSEDEETIRRSSLIGAVQLLQHADLTERLDMGEATSRTETIRTDPAFRIVRETVMAPVIDQSPMEEPEE